ncbi:coat protein [Chondrostereum purpureum cryptic virus 1]|uniref:Coat protein n=1 Tax=Chondrostereum purpureum cryptic virus 1 TaxID=529380 RepID=B7ZGY9_9VIRU|nr:coat protein [Chondrostereum purpureum cryptic virus 1]CAQ53730.1 coat protein [Chondrostereum purpureum cryptic virus 1]
MSLSSGPVSQAVLTASEPAVPAPVEYRPGATQPDATGTMTQTASGTANAIFQSGATTAPEQPPVLIHVSDDAKSNEKMSAIDITRIAICYPMSTDSVLVPSWFLPSSRYLYRIVQEMDIIMLNTHRFTQSVHAWSPLVSRVYIAVLFWIQTIRCMQATGFLPREGIAFINELLQDFPARTLVVPGPLVSLFRSLCASSPSFGTYGDVFPAFETAGIGASPANCFTLNSARFPQWYMLMPNVALLLDQLTCFTQACVNNPATIGDFVIGDDLFGTPFDGTIGSHRQQRVAPGMTEPVYFNTKAAENHASMRNLMALPTRLNYDPQNATPLTLNEMFRFNTDKRWFSRIISTMTVYSKFFDGSVTLYECPPVGPPAAQVSMVRTQPMRFEASNTAQAMETESFESTAISVNRSLSLHDEKVALAALINETLVSTGDQPIYAAQRLGPFWNISPTRRQAYRFDPSFVLPSVIRDHYALTTATR